MTGGDAGSDDDDPIGSVPGSGDPDDGGPGDDGQSDDGPSDGGGDDGGSDQVSAAETVVMVASAAFTVALFGFALWHAVAGAGAVPPTAEVVGSQAAPDGGVIYDVQLRNEGDVGLVTVTVSVGCTDPPIEVEFENVPAQGHRSGSVRCPPGTSDPPVTVSTWVRE